MESDRLDVGQALIVEAPQFGDRRRFVEGGVEERDDTEVVVTGLTGAESASAFVPGAAVRAQYRNTRGLFHFNSTVLSMSWAGAGRMVLRAPFEVTRVQRRRFLRLGLKLGVTCEALDGAGQAVDRLMAWTRELGGNGARVVAVRPVAIGRRIRVRVDLDRWGSCTAIGVVKRCERVDDDGAEAYAWALEFKEIQVKDQALLLSFLVAVQRANPGSGP